MEERGLREKFNSLSFKGSLTGKVEKIPFPGRPKILSKGEKGHKVIIYRPE